MSNLTLQWNTKNVVRAPPVPAEDWETHREELCRLFENVTLEDIMTSMKIRYRFTPSRHQYVLQFQKWGLQKYSKTKANRPQRKRSNATGSSQSYLLTPPSSGTRGSPYNTSESSHSASIKDPADSAPEQSLTQSMTAAAPTTFNIGTILEAEEGPAKASFRIKRSNGERGSSVPSPKRRKEEVGHGRHIAHHLDDKSTGLRPSPPPIPSKPAHLSGVSQRCLTVESGTACNTSPWFGFEFLESSKARESVTGAKGDVADVEAPLPQSASSANCVDSESILHNECAATDAEDPLLGNGPSSSHGLALQTNQRQIIDLDDCGSSHCSSLTLSISHIIEDLLELSEPSTHPETTVSSIELLRYAKIGIPSDEFTHEHVREMKKTADFFFSAQLFEDAFTIYLWIYKCLKGFHDTSVSTLFSTIVDLTRSSANRGQDEIVRNLLSESLRDHEIVADEDATGKFLLHSSMTLVCRNLGDLDAANQHRQQALHCFDLQSHCFSNLSRTWRPFALLAYKHLSMLLGKESQLLAAETFSTRLLCGNTEVALFQYAGVRRPALRMMLEWCSFALASPPIGSWRNLDSKDQGCRNIQVTALFSHFWWQWRHEETRPSISALPLPQFGRVLQETIGIVPLECLATIAFMIREAWSPLLDLLQVPIRPETRRTWEVHLQRCAINGLSKLLKLSDFEIAHSFLSAYSVQQFAGRDESTSTTSYDEIRRDYIRAYSARSIEIRLPKVICDQSEFYTQDYVPSQPAQLFLGPPLNPSQNTSSTGLASMKSMKERIQKDLTHAMDSAMNKIAAPSFSTLSGSDLDFDHLMGLAERSLSSLSVASSNVQQAVEGWESRVALSQGPSLVDTRG